MRTAHDWSCTNDPLISLTFERNTASLTKVLYNFFTSKEKDDDRTEQYQTQF